MFLLVGACSASQDSLSEVPQETLLEGTNLTQFELYEKYSEEIQTAYWAGDYDKVVEKLEDGFNLPHESTTYDNYVFNAVKFWRTGDIDKAKKVLEDFRLMLKIDEGLVECDVINNTLWSQENEEIVNKLVYEEMCWEMLISFYGQQNDSLKLHRDKLKNIAIDIESKLDRG